MTAPHPDSHHHIADLLPAYTSGNLPTLEAERVRVHLSHCPACQRECTDWEVLQRVTHSAIAAVPVTPPPPAQLMRQVWAKIDTPAPALVTRGWAPRQGLAVLWTLLQKQVPLIHRSIWVASALVCLFGCLLAFLMDPQTPTQLRATEEMLTLFITVVAATGAAFLYGSSVDPAFELTIATPTSIRLIMLCRMALVLGYNFVLAALTSTLFTFLHGGSLWSLMQLWLGPMLLLSSLSLTLSLLLGSAFALLCTALLETMQTLPADLEHSLLGLRLVGPNLWQTNPVMLALTLGLMIFAIVYLPRQPRLLR